MLPHLYTKLILSCKLNYIINLSFLAHLDFSLVSLRDRAVSIGESVTVRKHFSHYRLNRTHNFDETWPQASYLMLNEGLLTASKSSLMNCTQDDT